MEPNPGQASHDRGDGVAWRAPEKIVPCEVRPARFILVVALVLVVIITLALLTQRDNSGGFLTALFVAGGIGAFLVAIRSLVARIRLDTDGIVHTDLLGRRRIALTKMDRPVVVEPRRRGSGGDVAVRGYELIIRRVGGSGPWLLATGLFWQRRGLERMATALHAPTSPAKTRAAVEESYPGATTWLLRRTSTQWSIFLGIVLMVGLVLWQTR